MVRCKSYNSNRSSVFHRNRLFTVITMIVALPTESSCYCQEWYLVNDSASTDWAVVTQPRPLPNDPVHSRFLDYAVSRDRRAVKRQAAAYSKQSSHKFQDSTSKHHRNNPCKQCVTVLRFPWATVSLSHDVVIITEFPLG